jgi:hypothetical protein
MGTAVRLRSRGTRMLGAAMVVVAVLGVGSALFEGADVLLRFGAPVALFGVLGWAAFWEPYVEVSDGGVTVANTLRTVHVTWPAVEEVDGRYGLKLGTPNGAVSAWAASAPAGRGRARGEHSTTSAAVAGRLEELRAAGHLDNPRLEGTGVTSVWHQAVIATLVVLLVGTIVLPFVA